MKLKKTDEANQVVLDFPRPQMSKQTIYASLHYSSDEYFLEFDKQVALFSQ